MRDDQRDRRSAVALQPLCDNAVDHLCHVGLAGASVLQQRALFAEKQVKKRLLVIRAAGFTNDIEIRIIGVNLPLRHFGAVRPTRNPVRGNGSGFNPAPFGSGACAQLSPAKTIPAAAA